MNNEFKNEWSKWKLLGLILIIQAVSFSAGLYSGHTFWPQQSVQVVQPNYSTTGANSTIKLDTQTSQPNNSGECPIKGNISGNNKIYHIIGGAFYERTQEEMCFNSETEAQSAGFIKSSR